MDHREDWESDAAVRREGPDGVGAPPVPGAAARPDAVSPAPAEAPPPPVASYRVPHGADPRPPAAPPPWAGAPTTAAHPAPGAGHLDPGDDPYAFAGSAPAPAPARRTRRRWAAPAAALVLVAGGAGIAVALSGATSASATVIDAVTRTLADRTAQVTESMQMQLPSGTITATGTGGIDFTGNAMHLSTNVDAQGQQVQVQILAVKGVVYEDIPGLGQLLPGKSWISIDLSSLQAAGGSAATSLSAQGNPTALLRLLAQQGNRVRPLGSSTVGGVAVQGYEVDINPAVVQRELANADLPSWMRAALRETSFRNGTEQVFVDGSGNLRRLAYQVTASVGSQGSFTVHNTLDLSRYGSPVTVTVPPPAQTASMSQFLQSVASIGGQAGAAAP